MAGGQCGYGGQPTQVSVHLQEQGYLCWEIGVRRLSSDETPPEFDLNSY